MKNMIEVRDKKENIYSIIKGNQIILCKTQTDIIPQINRWEPCKLFASSMQLSHRNWYDYITQNPRDHTLPDQGS